jgi:hypothetical protein
MKFEIIDGEKYIYLDEGEKIFVSTTGQNENTKVEIQRKNGVLDIVAPRTMVNNIEKVDDKVESSEDIYKSCLDWLQAFIEIHDKFRKKAVLEKKRMVLRTHNYRNLKDASGSYCKTIELTLEPIDTHDQKVEGAYLRIDDQNEDIYKFLFAWVVDHYIAYNYKGCRVDDIFRRSKTLWSTELSSGLVQRRYLPTYADLFDVTTAKKEYNDIVDALIELHNSDVFSQSYRSGPVIDPLRNGIKSQVIKDDLLNESIKRTMRNHRELFKEEYEQDIRNRRR